MKRIIFIWIFSLIAMLPAMAQKTGVGTVQTDESVDPAKHNFAIKVNELSAYAQRNITDQLSKTMQQLTAMMNEQVEASQLEWNTADPSRKAIVKKTLDTQKKLLTEVKALTKDIVKNRTSLDKKLKAFYETL